MLVLQNEKIRVAISEDGKEITLTDLVRKQEWILDPLSVICQLPQDRDPKDPEAGHGLLTPLRAERLSDTAVKVSYTREGRNAAIHYRLEENYLETVLLAEGTGDMQQVSLPGSFLPADRTGMKYLYPIMQGMQWDLSGKPFEDKYREGAHVCFTMGMIGCMAANGGMLVTVETRDNTLWWTGKDAGERPWATNLQVQSLGAINYDRAVRIYFADSNITAIAKAYRARVIERGRFKSWEEKLKERPQLEKLFGATMCFLGYCQDNLDYAAEFKKLKAMGVDRALVYPVTFDNFGDRYLMGGLPPIHLDDETIQTIKDLGYDVAPWSFTHARIDNGSEEVRSKYRIMPDGSQIFSWTMNGDTWYECCTGEILEHKRRVNKGPLSNMTWDQFDVTACGVHRECHALDHPSHMDRVLTSGEEREFIRQMFLEAQCGSRAISSEGFNDVFSLEYDIGSVKALPQYGPWQFWPVPLTMLVYHDSMLHTWWEVHNYNSHYFGNTWGGGTHYQYGGGRARLMSAMDALYGCVPDVFPFGAQYGWESADSKNTVPYRFRLEDVEVQHALKLAKPVAELHRRIGMQEMLSFEFLTNDGYVQKTVFADGTEVYANFGPKISNKIDGLGHALNPESWGFV